MNWTAHLHPAFAEELALLPADLRIRLFSQIMLQELKGPLSQPVDFYFPHAEADPRLTLNTRFHHFGHAPRFLLALATKIVRDGFVYLAVMPETDDKTYCDIALERQLDISDGRVTPLNFQDFLSGLGHDDEYHAANKINSDIANLALNAYLLEEAFKEAREEASVIFNLCAPQMDRLLTRFDFFLSCLQQKLRNKSGDLTLEIDFKGAESKVFRALRELKSQAVWQKPGDF